MFNVLTENFKKEIVNQYKKKLVIVWLTAIISLQIFFLILILLPSYIYLVAEQRDLQASNNTAVNVNSQQNNSNISELSLQAKNELSALSSNIGLNTPGSLISRLTSLRGKSIQLKEIAYKVGTSTSSDIALHGVSATREDLLSFSKEVEADNVFYNINLPVSNFAKNKDIDFSMTMTTHI